MTLNSATAIIQDGHRLYSDSGSENLVAWIQEPISHQIFRNGILIKDLYLQVTPSVEVASDSDEIAREFAVWEAASDEALSNFEKENFSNEAGR
jgi:hypothetical protein